MLSTEEKLKLLRINSLLGKAPAGLLKKLAQGAQEQTYRRGDFVFARHDPAVAFYLLVDGRIGHPEVQPRQEDGDVGKVLGTTGQLFGFSAVLPGQPHRVVSARCESATRVLAMHGHWFKDLCLASETGGRAILRDLARAHLGYEQAVLGSQPSADDIAALLQEISEQAGRSTRSIGYDEFPMSPSLPAPAPGLGVETAPASNVLRQALANGRFFWTVEFIPSVDKILRDELHKLGGVAEFMRAKDGLAGFAVTDRVVSDRDPDPVSAAAHLLDHSSRQPLVHFSGKDRELEDLQGTLLRMQELGLENLMMVSGDRLKDPPRKRRPRYLESVAAIQWAKTHHPDMLLACALNPFKYREEEAMGQYLKLGRKVGAGADFIITQIGMDASKYEEALFWVATRGYGVPLVANVLQLTASRARYMRRHQLAGVVITDPVMALLEDEERLLPDRGAARSLRRLALQIVGVRLSGYAGIQLTGIHHPDKLLALEALVAELSDLCSNRLTWSQAWRESLTSPAGWVADTAPPGGWSLSSPRQVRAGLPQRIKYRSMQTVHALLFERGIAARAASLLTTPVARHGGLDRLLVQAERAIKRPLFGCETCGMCRLPETQYVCPETCPKGLANGPCGGTTANRCEFGDRECVHNNKYRLAKENNLLEALETRLIPAVPQDSRNSSSWPAHFRGEGPRVDVVHFPRREAAP